MKVIERTWWRLFQKRVVCTKFDFYVFMKYHWSAFSTSVW